MEKPQVLSILSNDRKANLSFIKEKAAKDDVFGSNDLKELVSVLREMPEREINSKYGLTRSDIFTIDMIRSNVVKRLPKDQVTDGWYFPGKSKEIRPIREARLSAAEKKSAAEEKYQSGIRNRSLPEEFVTGARALAEGWLAPGMANAFQQRGLSVDDALSYIDWNDPLQASMANVGFGLNQGQIPGISSIPGNLAGGRLGGAIGSAIGRAFSSPAARWLGAGGGLAGGLLGAMATGALGNKFLNPVQGLSKENQQVLFDRFSGPERTIGDVLSPVGIFSIRQGPAKTFFEGAGGRAGLSALINKRSGIGSETFIAPATDAGSRIAQVFQTENDIKGRNEEARRRFFEDNGYEATSEEDLIPYGFTDNSGRLNQAFMNLTLGGFGKFGRAVSGETIGEFIGERQAARDARRVLDQINKGAGTAPTSRPAAPTTRVAPFGIFRVDVPGGTKEGKTITSRVNVTYNEGDNRTYEVKPGTAAMLPRTQQGVAAELRKTPEVEADGKFVNIVGVSPSGEIFVTTQDDAQNTVVRTALYSDLPPALQKQVDKASISATTEGTPKPKWDAVSDTAYAATQDANPAYSSAFPNTLNIDGVEVQARVLKVDDADNMAHVVLPSGSILYVNKDLVNTRDNKPIFIGGQKRNDVLSTATDSKGRSVFGEVEIRGQKYLAYRKEGTRVEDVEPVNMNDFVVQQGAQSADKANIGTVLDLGTVKVGGRDRAETGIIVGVDNFKVGDAQASGYWVQSTNDPLAKPFLVTQEFVDSQKAAAGSGVKPPSGKGAKGAKGDGAAAKNNQQRKTLEEFLKTREKIRQWWETIGNNKDEWAAKATPLLEALKNGTASDKSVKEFTDWFESSTADAMNKALTDAEAAVKGHEYFDDLIKEHKDPIVNAIEGAKSALANKDKDAFDKVTKALEVADKATRLLDLAKQSSGSKPPQKNDAETAKKLSEDLDAALTSAKNTSQWKALDGNTKRNLGGLVSRLKTALASGKFDKIAEAQKVLNELQSYKDEVVKPGDGVKADPTSIFTEESLEIFSNGTEDEVKVELTKTLARLRGENGWDRNNDIDFYNQAVKELENRIEIYLPEIGSIPDLNTASIVIGATKNPITHVDVIGFNRTDPFSDVLTVKARVSTLQKKSSGEVKPDEEEVKPDEEEVKPDEEVKEGKGSKKKKGEQKKNVKRPEGAPQWPEGYKIDVKHPRTGEVIYSETFGEVADDANLPPEMRSTERGDEYYRYRRMTAGEQAEKIGDPKNLPKQFLENIRILAGKFVGRVSGKGDVAQTVDLEVELQSITSREDLVGALKRVFKQTDEQAQALANTVDRFATGWSLEMMRLSGMSTQEVYRAARTATELQIAFDEKISSFDLKDKFREQSTLRTDKQTLETLKKLRTYYYAQRLGNIAVLTTEQSAKLGTSGLVTGWRGSNQVVNVAFALSGSKNYVAQVHEVTHLLVRSMYAPMYHQLAASVMRTYGMSNPNFDFRNPRRIDGWVEERIVTSFLRAMVTSEGKKVLDEGRREGGSGHDVSINKVLNDLGAQLKLAASAMGPNDPQNILASQGWAVGLKRNDAGRVTGFFPIGTSFLFDDGSGDIKELVLEQEWNADTHPNATLQGVVISRKSGAYSAQKASALKLKITQNELEYIGQLRATMGRPVVETEKSRDLKVANYVINESATRYLSQFFGHWGEWTHDLLSSIDPIPVEKENFVPESQASIQRFAFGYRWWQTPADFRDATGVDVDTFSDARIYARTGQSYLGWLDAGGYEQFLTADQIQAAEWGVLEDIKDSVETPVIGTENKEELAIRVQAPSEEEDLFMSTFVGKDKQPKGKGRQIVIDIVSEFLTGNDGRVLDIRAVKDELIDRFIALPILQTSVLTTWNKQKGLEGSDKPLFLRLTPEKMRQQLMTSSQSSVVNAQWRLFSNRSDNPKELGAVQRERARVTKEVNRQLSNDAKEVVRNIRARLEHFETALTYGLKPKEWYQRTEDRLSAGIDLDLRSSDVMKFRQKELENAIKYVREDLDMDETIPLKDIWEDKLDENGNKIPILDYAGKQIYRERYVEVRKNGKIVIGPDGEPEFRIVKEPAFEQTLKQRGLLTESGRMRHLETRKDIGVAELRSEFDPEGKFDSLTDQEFHMQYKRRVNYRKNMKEYGPRVQQLLDRLTALTDKDERKTVGEQTIFELQSMGLLLSPKLKKDLPGIGSIKDTATDLHPLKGAELEKIREYRYEIVGADGQARVYTYKYTLGSVTKPGYSEEDFRRQFIEQRRGQVESDESLSGLQESLKERTSRYMFGLGYENISTLPKLRELAMGRSGQQYSRGLDYLNDIKIAMQDQLQFATTINGVIHFLEVEKENNRIVGTARWVAVTPEELADRMLSAAYRSINATTNVIRREQASVTSVGVDIQKQSYALVRDFVSSKLQASDPDNYIESELTYLSAYKAVDSWRRRRKEARNYVTLTKENIANYTQGKSFNKYDVEVFLPNQLLENIRNLQKIAKSKKWTADEFRVAVKSTVLSDTNFRFIPAIADYQFRSNYPEQQQVVEAIRFDGYSVQFADVSGVYAGSKAVRNAALKDLGKLDAINAVSKISLQGLMTNPEGELGNEPAELGVEDEAIKKILEWEGPSRLVGVESELQQTAVDNLKAVFVDMQSDDFKRQVFLNMSNALWDVYMAKQSARYANDEAAWVATGLGKVTGKTYSEIQARVNLLENYTSRNTDMSADAQIELDKLKEFIAPFEKQIQKRVDALFSEDGITAFGNYISKNFSASGDSRMTFKDFEKLQNFAESKFSHAAPVASIRGTKGIDRLNMIRGQFEAFKDLLTGPYAGSADTIIKSLGLQSVYRTLSTPTSEGFDSIFKFIENAQDENEERLAERFSDDLESFAEVMDNWMVIASAMRKRRAMTSTDILVDNAATIELMPSLTVQEVGVLRMLQAQSAIEDMRGSTKRIAAVLNKAEKSVRAISDALYKKINDHETMRISQHAASSVIGEQAGTILRKFLTVANEPWAIEAMKDQKTVSQRMTRLIEVSVNMLVDKSKVPENDVELFDTWKETGQWVFSNAKKSFVFGAYDQIVGVIGASSVLRTQQQATSFDELGRIVYAGSTSDTLGSTSKIMSMLRGNKSILTVGGRQIHVSAFAVPRGSTLYKVVLERINKRGVERNFLTNAELRSIVLSNRENISQPQIIETLKTLINQRDEMVLNPLKDYLQKQNLDGDLASATIESFNNAMDAAQLSEPDRLVAMSAVMNAVTRQNEPDLVAWMLVNKRLPTEAEYLNIKGLKEGDEGVATAKNNWKDLENLQKSVGINAIVDGIVGSKLTVVERGKAEAERQPVISFALDLRPQDLPLTESLVQSSIAYQGSIIQDFVDKDGNPSLGQLTAVKLDQALDSIRLGVKVADSPLRLSKMPGATRTGERLTSKLDPEYKIQPGEEEEVGRARIASRVLRTGIDSIRHVFSTLDGNGSDRPLSEINAVFARVSQRSLEAAWTRSSAIDAIDVDNRGMIEPALNKLARALTRNILNARASMVAAMRVNPELDGLSYEIQDHWLRTIVVAKDSSGMPVYEIDYNSARVWDIRDGKKLLLTASPQIQFQIPSKPKPLPVSMTESEKALYELLTVGIDETLGAKDGSFWRIAEAVMTTPALRSVPPVYWHAQLRVQAKVENGVQIEPMFLSTFNTNPVSVNNSVGTVDETTRVGYVMPVIQKWLKPDLAGVQRVALNRAGEPFFDGEGYSVWREDGKRSHVFAMLIDHGLSPDKALEIYAMTEHPAFKKWSVGQLIESPMMKYPGSIMNQGRVKFAGAVRPIQQGMAAQDLVSAVDRFLEDPTNANFDDFAFAYDEVDAFGAGVSDKDLLKLMTEIRDSPDRDLKMAIIRDKAAALVSMYSTDASSSILNSYRAYKDGEQRIATGKPFYTLAFRNITDSFIGFAAPGVSTFDLGTGLYKNSNRKNRPNWIKFENPLVHNIGNTNVDVETVKELANKAIASGHDGVVLMNVVDSINDMTRRNIAITLNDANILPVARMHAPASVARKATSADVEPMFLSTPMLAPVTSNDIPPLLPEGVEIRERTRLEQVGRFSATLYDNLMSLARSPLSGDMAVSFIQGGRSFLGLATGRPQDFMAWLKGTFGSMRGLAPNLQVSIGGKKIGYDKLGRRQWIKVYQEIRKDPYWDAMKALKVPLHFMNFERKLESERVRLYSESRGEVAFEDIEIDMLAYDERGNLDDIFDNNTLVGMLPLAGMFERQMSLQHDLIMFHQIKWQLQNNPEFKTLLESNNPIEAISNSRSANAMVGFIATSMGDFQYTTNDKVDIWMSRIGKAVFQAPRWYAANVAIAWPISLAVDYVYRRSPTFRKFVGTGNRSFGLYDHQNKELFAYQLKTWGGSMIVWLVSALGAMVYGRMSRRADYDWNLSKGFGMFRLGDWEISESTGSLDALNQMNAVVRDLGRGGIGTKPRLGETSEEAENAGFLRAIQRLGYKKSPLITLFYDKVYRGRDSLNRAVYRSNEEFLFTYESVFKEVLNPIFKSIGVKLWDAEELPLSSMLVTGQVPTAWQDYWAAYTASGRSEYGDKSKMRKAAALQYFWSFLGTRVKYSPYVPDEMRQMYNKQWVLKRFIEQQGPTGIELLRKEGLDGWFKAARTGNPD